MKERMDMLEARMMLLEELVRVLLNQQNIVMQQITKNEKYVISETLYKMAYLNFSQRVQTLIETDPYLEDKIRAFLDTIYKPPQ